MTLVDLKQETPPRTFVQVVAAVLRAASDKLDGGAPRQATLEELQDALRYDAEIALLNAEAEEERHRFTVGMLRERVRRLSCPQRNQLSSSGSSGLSPSNSRTCSPSPSERPGSTSTAAQQRKPLTDDNIKWLFDQARARQFGAPLSSEEIVIRTVRAALLEYGIKDAP